MNTLITRSDINTRIREIRTELESRHKTGMVKMAQSDGTPISTETLQNEMFALTYRLSKFD
jgi:hypothetical protein